MKEFIKVSFFCSSPGGYFFTALLWFVNAFIAAYSSSFGLVMVVIFVILGAIYIGGTIYASHRHCD